MDQAADPTSTSRPPGRRQARRLQRGTSVRRVTTVLGLCFAMLVTRGQLSGTFASYQSETVNPANGLAATTLAPPGTPVTSHTSLNGGMATVTWTASSSPFVTGYLVQRS